MAATPENMDPENMDRENMDMTLAPFIGG